MSRLSALIMAAALAACNQTAPPTAGLMDFKEPDPVRNVAPSATYRADVASYLRSTLKDPGSVRDAMIGEPEVKFMGAANRYAACVRFNAKNSYGGFTGPTEHLAVFLDGRVISVEEALSVQCRGTSYSPFTELAAVARSAR